MLLAWSVNSFAQVVLTESFTGAAFPPLGWSTQQVSGNNFYNTYSRAATGTDPICLPASAPAMCRFHSYLAPTGESTILATPPFDLTGVGGSTPTVNFNMYRDNFGFYGGYNDYLEIYINTTRSLSGATLLGKIYRSRLLNPVVATDGWYNYIFNIPPTYSGFFNHIIFKAVSDDGNNMFIDDISYDSYPTNMSYNSATTTQNIFDVGAGSNTNQVIGIQVVMSGGANPFDLTQLNLTTTGTTNPANISNAKIWYTGNSSNFSAINQFGTTVAAPSGGFSFNGIQSLQNGTNYFWLTYDVAVAPPIGNLIDATCNSIVINGIPRTATITAPVGARRIWYLYCQPTYSVGTGSGDYISNVRLNNINNSTLGSAFPYYTYYSNLSTALARNVTYKVYFSNGSVNAPNNRIAVWIDWNQDGDFFDAGEKLGEKTLNGAFKTDSLTFTIPATAVLGYTRMRVRDVYTGTAGLSPCTPPATTYGETEDYNIEITPFCLTGTWLGVISDDWNTGVNWCGTVPTITTDVVIPPGTPFSPVIYNTVNAFTRNLNILPGSTVTISAPTKGSLNIYGDLWIQNLGTLKVNPSLGSIISLGTGTIASGAATPYRGNASDARNQYLYANGELSSLGMAGGDVITDIGFNVTTKGSSIPYDGFSIKLGHTTLNSFSSPNFVPGASQVFNPASINSISGWNQHTFNNNFVWNGTDDLLTDVCYDNALTTAADLVMCSSTFNRVLRHGSAGGSGCTLPGSVILGTRPNIRFYYYTPFPIAVKQEWINDGTFSPSTCRVIFDGTLDQNITGNNITTFYELRVKKNSGILKLNKNANVQDKVELMQGIFDLNAYTLNLLSNSTLALTRTTGFIRSETLPPLLGKLRWNINTTTSGNNYTIPWINTGGNYIPFKFNITSAGTTASAAYIDFATYKTNANNSPWPSGVTHIKNENGLDNYDFMADRFWIADAKNYTLKPASIISITYDSMEAASPNTISEVNLQAQRWNPGLNKWGDFGPAGTVNVATGVKTVTVTVAAADLFPNWTLVDRSSPLPIELLHFTAKLDAKSEVDLSWATASERNNAWFVIEKTRDAKEYHFVNRTPGAGNSSSTREYTAKDPAPFQGLSYYRLAQIDYDGTTVYSPLVAINLKPKGNFELVNAWTGSNENELNINFLSSGKEKLNLKLSDALGREILKEEINAGQEGLMQIKIDLGSLSKGAYVITLDNGKEMRSRKWIY